MREELERRDETSSCNVERLTMGRLIAERLSNNHESWFPGQSRNAINGKAVTNNPRFVNTVQAEHEVIAVLND